MRVTQSMYYKNFATDSSKVQKGLFDVNRQISSGHKIQYAYEDATTFAKTMRLDNEVTTLTQTKKSAESALKFSTQTDTTLNEVSKTLDSFKVKLIQAASGGQSQSSMDATAKELEGLRAHLLTLSNTSIDGKYLFSGTSVGTKPISDDGQYHGNSSAMESLLGSGVKRSYNIPGSSLFLGDETQSHKKVSTNVRQFNLAKQFPDIMTDTTQNRKEVAKDEYINDSSTIRDLMGDLDTNIDTVNAKHHFYITGTKSSGETFKDRIDMRDDESVNDLMDRIGIKFGNTPSNQVVNVTLNHDGQIEIEDKIKGSSKLDFHMVGATDLDDSGNDDAKVNDIDQLDDGETDFAKIVNGDSTAVNKKLYVKEFMKSGFSPSDSANSIEGIQYDRTQFSQSGAKLNSNVSQILKTDNAYATNSTKLSEVFDTSQSNAGTLDGTTLKLKGKDVNGNAYDVSIDLKNSGSTFSVGGTSYDIYNATDPRAAVSADNMTYKQLNDVINMVVSNNLPASNSADDYDRAIKNADKVSETFLDSKGRITFDEKGVVTSTKASISLYDNNSANYTDGAASSVATFNANDTFAISDVKTDFFGIIDEAIEAVKSNKFRADATEGNPRNAGIENAISMLDDLNNHVGNVHSTAGVNSQTLQTSRDRTEILIVATQTLRSETIDTDIADASLKLNQLSLNYQAMMSTVSKVSKLSLVNYI